MVLTRVPWPREPAAILAVRRLHEGRRRCERDDYLASGPSCRHDEAEAFCRTVQQDDGLLALLDLKSDAISTF